MNKKGLIIALTVVVLIIAGVTLLGPGADKNINPDTQTTDQNTNLLIENVEIIDDDAVYALLSNGEQRRFAEFVPFENNNFTEVRTYQSYKISPNKKFVAIEGSAFEEGIVQVYEVETDTLYEVMYGDIDDWTADGLLKIKSCNLAGEQCSNKISTSPNRPWEVKKMNDSIDSSNSGNTDDSNTSTASNGNFDSDADFISNINSDTGLQLFGSLLTD